MLFSSDPAVSSSIFVRAEREELIRNDPGKSECTIRRPVEIDHIHSGLINKYSHGVFTGI